jgi:hypothetical protein
MNQGQVANELKRRQIIGHILARSGHWHEKLHNKRIQPTPLRGAADAPRWAAGVGSETKKVGAVMNSEAYGMQGK